MRSAVYASLDPRHADRLLFAGAAAIALHTWVILGVGFDFEPPEARELENINVTLVLEPSDREPDIAYEIAMANQRGGDEQAANRSASDPLAAALPAPAAKAAQAPAASPEPPGLVTATSGAPQATDSASSEAAPSRAKPTDDAKVARTPVLREAPDPADKPTEVARRKPGSEPRTPTAQQSEPTPLLDRATLLAQAREVASLSARLGERASATARGPREATVTSNTREHRLAAYMDAWRQKVERIGNLNYPERARRAGLAGTLLLDVAITRDGKVSEMRLLRSSGHQELDRAAQRIVELAAPFAEFPVDLARDFDIIHVQRTWRFSVIGLEAS